MWCEAQDVPTDGIVHVRVFSDSKKWQRVRSVTRITINRMPAIELRADDYRHHLAETHRVRVRVENN